jgi:hypothetical protein
MKKLALTIVCAMAVSGAAFAQGYIQWATPTTGVSFQTNSTQYSPLFGGQSVTGGSFGNTANTSLGLYDYILLSQADPSATLPTDTSVWDGTWTGNTVNGGGQFTALSSGSGPGSLGRANQQVPNGSQQVNWANGTTRGVVIVGWSANLGTSWAAVSNALTLEAVHDYSGVQALLAANGGGLPYFGETAFGYINPTIGLPGIAITQAAPGAGANGLSLYSLNTQLYLLPVPEPATMALAGLGGLSLLLFRRRRQ